MTCGRTYSPVTASRTSATRGRSSNLSGSAAVKDDGVGGAIQNVEVHGTVPPGPSGIPQGDEGFRAGVRICALPVADANEFSRFLDEGLQGCSVHHVRSSNGRIAIINLFFSQGRQVRLIEIESGQQPRTESACLQRRSRRMTPACPEAPGLVAVASNGPSGSCNNVALTAAKAWRATAGSVEAKLARSCWRDAQRNKNLFEKSQG